MLTKELITTLAEQTGITKKRAEELLDVTSAVIVESLCNGQTVAIQNIGNLEPKQRAERVIVHPKTGERSVTPAKMQISYKPSTAIKEELKNI